MRPDDSREDNPHPHRHRRRRAKKLLRFVPRRATLHKYPIVGRFADFARRRAYLWSFRPQHLRPSFYAGSVLALLPVMGVQLPVALVLSLVLRGNFMVMGGLQFITNPFTAAPIYYATHQLGAKVIELSGVGHSFKEVELPVEAEVESEESPSRLEPAQVLAEKPIHWTQRVGTAINALVLGGTIAGTMLGALLDLLSRWMHIPPARRAPRTG